LSALSYISVFGFLIFINAGISVVPNFSLLATPSKPFFPKNIPNSLSAAFTLVLFTEEPM